MNTCDWYSKEIVEIQDDGPCPRHFPDACTARAGRRSVAQWPDEARVGLKSVHRGCTPSTAH